MKNAVTKKFPSPSENAILRYLPFSALCLSQGIVVLNQIYQFRHSFKERKPAGSDAIGERTSADYTCN